MKNNFIIIREANVVKITTADAYDYQNKEYFKLPKSVIKIIYDNLSLHYKIYEFYLTKFDRMTSLELKTSWIKRRVDDGYRYVHFEEFDPSKLEQDFLTEMHWVISNDLDVQMEKLKIMDPFHSFKELRESLNHLAPAVISIYDYSDVYLHFSEKAVADLSLKGLE